MKKVNKNWFKIILILVVLLPVLGYSQTKKQLPALDSLPYLTADTTLNKFMLHWLGKPYKLGGKTERGIDCSQFTKRLYKDVYGKQIEIIPDDSFAINRSLDSTRFREATGFMPKPWIKLVQDMHDFA